jgi:hypothetical protein
LLEHFVKSTARTTTTFHCKKTGNNPSVVHAVEIAEFNSAKAAVNKDLGHLLGSRLTNAVVYSIHYSDINGLSRLEINILAHEISEYFGKEMNSDLFNFSNSNQPRRTYLSIFLIPQSSTTTPKQEAGQSLSAPSMRPP